MSAEIIAFPTGKIITKSARSPTAKQMKWIDDIIQRLRDWNEGTANG